MQVRLPFFGTVVGPEKKGRLKKQEESWNLDGEWDPLEQSRNLGNQLKFWFGVFRKVDRNLENGLWGRVGCGVRWSCLCVCWRPKPDGEGGDSMSITRNRAENQYKSEEPSGRATSWSNVQRWDQRHRNTPPSELKNSTGKLQRR